MVDILKICHDFDAELSKCENKDDILMECVTQKLSSLYIAQSEQLDNILNELTRFVDTDDVEYMYKIIKRLSKNLSGNRIQLIKLIEGVNK